MLSASDIDIIYVNIYVNGYGFPAHRVGPMWHAEAVGFKQVYDRICQFHRLHGEIWQPSPLPKQLAEPGKTLLSRSRTGQRPSSLSVQQFATQSGIERIASTAIRHPIQHWTGGPTGNGDSFSRPSCPGFIP